MKFVNFKILLKLRSVDIRDVVWLVYENRAFCKVLM